MGQLIGNAFLCFLISKIKLNRIIKDSINANLLILQSSFFEIFKIGSEMSEKVGKLEIFARLVAAWDGKDDTPTRLSSFFSFLILKIQIW